MVAHWVAWMFIDYTGHLSMICFPYGLLTLSKQLFKVGSHICKMGEVDP